jgi:hypothetical protein
MNQIQNPTQECCDTKAAHLDDRFDTLSFELRNNISSLPRPCPCFSFYGGGYTARNLNHVQS